MASPLEILLLQADLFCLNRLVPDIFYVFRYIFSKASKINSLYCCINAFEFSYFLVRIMATEILEYFMLYLIKGKQNKFAFLL